MEVDVQIRRIGPGPTLIVEQADELVAHFLANDASARPGGYDDLAGRGEADRIMRDDIVAINRTMRARSPHSAWEPLINDPRPLPWLVALDPSWDLIAGSGDQWDRRLRGAVESALSACTGPGRGYSVGTKVLHLKRPLASPVLDSLVLQQLGVTDSVPMIRVVTHLRAEGIRNLPALRAIQAAIAPRRRSFIRILDILLWASHPASRLAPSMAGWTHVFARRANPTAREMLRPPEPRSMSVLDPPEEARPSWMARRSRSFEDVWACIRSKGTFRAVSSRGTEYRVTAATSKGRRVLIARPRSGGIYIHADCFGQDLTCQGTRAGGIYNGSPSVWDC